MSSRYYGGAVSDHFDGKRFFNLYAPTVDRSLADIWRWRRNAKATPWPPRERRIASDHPPCRSARLRIAMVGHASLLIQLAGANILIDPVWSARASPLPFAGPRRHQPPGIAFSDLPPIDLVLLTHSHYDHMDLATLKRLHTAHRPIFVAPLGNDTILAPLAVRAGDWWETVELAEGMRVTLTPANHWSSRTLVDRRRALWCGYVVQAGDMTLYLAGDTAFGEGDLFRVVRAHHAPDVAVLPIGAYEPRWFMASQHMSPAEAVAAFVATGAGQALGIHWGTFRLTDEGQNDPPSALAAALIESGLAPDCFQPLRPGAHWPSERQPADGQ